MASALVPDTLWEIVEPLLPLPKPKPQGGRPRMPDRVCLKGIVFVLRSGIPWEMLPKELGCGSGMTCWRRLRDWQKSGIWQLIHFALLDWLGRFNQIDWSRANAVCDRGRGFVTPTASMNAPEAKRLITRYHNPGANERVRFAR